jgi:uncharacterized membrane protein
MIDLVRERLLAMRHEEAVRILRHHPSSMTTAIDAMLAALDEMTTDAQPATRAVVADDDKEIRLMLCAEEGAVASAALDPIAAIGLAGRLIEAALLRLTGE